MADGLTLHDYQALAAFRYELRRFVARTEANARAAGLEPQQHQLLLACKGLAPTLKPTINTLAERLQIQHQSVVELIDRLEEKGLVCRRRSESDLRIVLVELTQAGHDRLAPLALASFHELGDTGVALLTALRTIIAQTTHY